MLKRIDGDLPRTWRLLRIEKVLACKLFFVGESRNAWWGTWVTRWVVDSFHFDRERAYKHAERLRTQGSVFQVAELPALMLSVPRGYGLVTQLGTIAPLADYQPPATSSETAARLAASSLWWRGRKDRAPDFVKRQLRLEPEECQPCCGHELGKVMDSFRDESLFWRPGGEERVAVRLLGTAKDGYPDVLGARHRWQTWESRSGGGHYLLGWIRKENPVRATSVRKLARSVIKVSGPEG